MVTRRLLQGNTSTFKPGISASPICVLLAKLKLSRSCPTNLLIISLWPVLYPMTTVRGRESGLMNIDLFSTPQCRVLPEEKGGGWMLCRSSSRVRHHSYSARAPAPIALEGRQSGGSTCLNSRFLPQLWASASVVQSCSHPLPQHGSEWLSERRDDGSVLLERGLIHLWFRFPFPLGRVCSWIRRLPNKEAIKQVRQCCLVLKCHGFN